MLIPVGTPVRVRKLTDPLYTPGGYPNWTNHTTTAVVPIPASARSTVRAGGKWVGCVSVLEFEHLGYAVSVDADAVEPTAEELAEAKREVDEHAAYERWERGRYETI